MESSTSFSLFFSQKNRKKEEKKREDLEKRVAKAKEEAEEAEAKAATEAEKRAFTFLPIASTNSSFVWVKLSIWDEYGNAVRREGGKKCG